MAGFCLSTGTPAPQLVYLMKMLPVALFKTYEKVVVAMKVLGTLIRVFIERDAMDKTIKFYEKLYQTTCTERGYNDAWK